MKLLRLAVIFLSLGAACGARQTTIEDRGIALVIVNPANTATPDLADLRDFYLGRKRHWAGNTPVVVVDVPGRLPHRERFLERVIGLSAPNYERAVVSEVYATSWRGPQRLADDTAMIHAVATTRGAVGVIAPASLTPELASRVRVLLKL